MIRRANRSGWNKGRTAAVAPEREILRMKPVFLAAVAATMFVISPVASFAQSSGGSAGGSAGSSSGSAAGSPSAGAAGAGSQGVSGTPPGPAAPGGLNNVGEDPSGQANSVRRASPLAPGTNTAGTAQSSGSGITTGSARSPGSGTSGDDVEINKENKEVDRKIKSICRGC